MTKNEFWEILMDNIYVCETCPLSREGLCKKYSVGEDDEKVDPCYSPKMFRKAYEEMEDDQVEYSYR